MSIAIELRDQQPLVLAEAAQRLQMNEADLAAAAVRDLVGQPHEDFDAAAERVLKNKRELSRRLAGCVG